MWIYFYCKPSIETKNNNFETAVRCIQWRHELCGTEARAPSTLQLQVYRYAYNNVLLVQHQDISTTHEKERELEAPYFLTAKFLEVV